MSRMDPTMMMQACQSARPLLGSQMKRRSCSTGDHFGEKPERHCGEL